MESFNNITFRVFAELDALLNQDTDFDQVWRDGPARDINNMLEEDNYEWIRRNPDPPGLLLLENGSDDLDAYAQFFAARDSWDLEYDTRMANVIIDEIEKVRSENCECSV